MFYSLIRYQEFICSRFWAYATLRSEFGNRLAVIPRSRVILQPRHGQLAEDNRVSEPQWANWRSDIRAAEGKQVDASCGPRGAGRSVDAAWPLFGRRHFASQSWPPLRSPSPFPLPPYPRRHDLPRSPFNRQPVRVLCITPALVLRPFCFPPFRSLRTGDDLSPSLVLLSGEN